MGYKAWAGSLVSVTACVLIALFVLGQPLGRAEMVSQGMDHPAIEWLTFHVPPDQQAFFVEKDEEIWTPVLAESSGFGHKQVWTNPNNSEAVTFVIYWTSREAWKAIPEELLEETTRRFNDAVGEAYPLVEAKEFYPLS